VPLWRRRRKALHEELADGTGLLEWKPKSDSPRSTVEGMFDVLHGGRQREWDAVATAEAPDLAGTQLEFAVLPDGTMIVDEEVSEGALAPLADAVEQSLQAPYRAVAVRRDGSVWGVAARSIEVVDVQQEIPGDTVSLAVQGGERTLLVDDRPGWESIPALEAHGAATHSDFVLTAERLDGSLWAVVVNPL
jgi:hypothetical protein